MRRSLLWAGLLVVVAPGLAVGQDQGWAAKFFTSGLRHDFGSVPFGAQLSHKFTITNIYNVPFVVEEARVSCGCVTMKKPATNIPPRGTAELEANMDMRKIGATGQPKVVTIFVKLTSVPQNPTDKVFTSACTLTVISFPQSHIRFSTDKMYFGSVNLGQTPKAIVDIQHFQNPAFEIVGVAKHNHPVDVTVEKAQPAGGGRVAFRITATLRPNAPAGEINYEVQLTTNDKNTPVIDVLMQGIVQAPLVATPNAIDMGNIKVGEVVSRYVVVRGNGTPFKIVGIEGEGDGIKVKMADKAAPAHTLVVEFVPAGKGAIAKTLKVKTDMAGDLSATFTVTGAGQ